MMYMCIDQPLTPYKKARKLFYLNVIGIMHSYPIEEGKKVRKSLYQIQYRSKMKKAFKTKVLNDKMYIWQEHMI